TVAGSTSFLIRTIRTLFSLHCGRRDGSRGFSLVAGQEVGFTDLTTTASPGNTWRATASQKESWGESGSRFPVPTPTAFMQSSRQRKAGFIVPMTPDNIGLV